MHASSGPRRTDVEPAAEGQAAKSCWGGSRHVVWVPESRRNLGEDETYLLREEGEEVLLFSHPHASSLIRDGGRKASLRLSSMAIQTGSRGQTRDVTKKNTLRDTRSPL